MNEFPSFKRDGHPPFKYEGQGLTGEVITSACNVLDIAGIPSVLWGELLMRVHGVDFVVQASSRHSHYNLSFYSP